MLTMHHPVSFTCCSYIVDSASLLGPGTLMPFSHWPQLSLWWGVYPGRAPLLQLDTLPVNMGQQVAQEAGSEVWSETQPNQFHHTKLQILKILEV